MGLEPTIYRLEVCRLIHLATGANYMEVPPRFELGFPDSKSDVLTTTLWDQFVIRKHYQQGSNLRGHKPRRILSPTRLPLRYDKVLLYVLLIMTPTGFEPAPPKRSELESDALDHSAIVSVLKSCCY